MKSEIINLRTRCTIELFRDFQRIQEEEKNDIDYEIPYLVRYEVND